jgi:tetratricopeptide (TPR) repeat protein
MPDSPRFAAAQLYEEARLRRFQGNPSGAVVRYRRVLEIAGETGDRGWMGEIAAEIGEMYRDACDAMAARRWLEEALDHLRAAGEAAQAGTVLLRLGQVEQLAAAPEAATRRFEEALPLLTADSERGEVLAGLAQVLWDLKRDEEAAAAAARAAALLRTDDPEAAEALRERVREWKWRLGGARLRQLLKAAAPDEETFRFLSGG